MRDVTHTKTRRFFDESFKRRCLEKANQVGVAKAAREMGVTPVTIYSWKNKAAKRRLEKTVSQLLETPAAPSATTPVIEAQEATAAVSPLNGLSYHITSDGLSLGQEGNFGPLMPWSFLKDLSDLIANKT